MKKIIIAPDSFKETMTNIEVANIIYESLKQKYPNYIYKVLPIADGGEGSLNAILQSGGILKSCIAKDANGDDQEVNYLLLNDSIVVEVAQNVGFKYKHNYSNPGNTTTFGIGEVIKKAINHEINNVYICLGGTITNDGGCGLAAALGVKFFDEANNEFVPRGDTLKKIKHIDKTDFIKEFGHINFIGLCDVINPLHGKMGASYIFAPQKGATMEQVEELDQGLKHLEKIVINDLGIDKANCEGSGAAGGLGYSLLSFLDGKLQKGINTILDLIHFDDEIKGECVVITGEGKLDSQSLNGKVISGIVSRVNDKAEVIAVCGKMEGTAEYYKSKGISQVIVTNKDNIPFEEVKKICKKQLKEAVENVRI